jgi:hypothetical protein
MEIVLFETQFKASVELLGKNIYRDFLITERAANEMSLIIGESAVQSPSFGAQVSGD